MRGLLHRLCLRLWREDCVKPMPASPAIDPSHVVHRAQVQKNLRTISFVGPTRQLRIIAITSADGLIGRCVALKMWRPLLPRNHPTKSALPARTGFPSTKPVGGVRDV